MMKLVIVYVFALLVSVTAQNEQKLYDAAKKGNIADVQQALASGANVNWKKLDYSRVWSILHVASYHNRAEVVKILLDAGADVDLQDNTKRTALHYVAANDLLASMKVLLDAGANTELLDQHGSAPLHYAAAVHYTAPEDRVKAVIMLLSAGADIDVREDGTGKTPLCIATDKTKTDVVRALIDRGADPNIPRLDRRYRGMTPLMQSAHRVDITSVNILIRAGANVNQVTDNGETVLHFLVLAPIISDEERSDQLEIAKILVRKVVDLKKKDKRGHTAGDIARVWGRGDLTLANMIDNYDGPNPIDLALFDAAKSENVADLNKALASGANPNWKNTDQEPHLGWTALHVSTYNNDLAVMSALLDAGANIDEWSDDGRTPIAIAAGQWHKDTLQTLLDYCADVNLPQNDGMFSEMTPLMVAITEGYLPTVETLIDAHANVNQSTDSGFTALHMAALGGQQDIVPLLLQKGADVLKKDIRGRSPSDVARDKGHLEIANIIDSYTGPYDPPVPATTCQSKATVAIPVYDLYLMACDVVIFITATLYSVLH